jgi:hypothetical protein
LQDNYQIEGHPKAIHIKFPHKNNNMVDLRSYELAAALAPLTLGS